MKVVRKIGKILLTILFFPLVHGYKTLRGKRKIGYKIGHTLLSLFLLPFWAILGLVLVYVCGMQLAFPLVFRQTNGFSMEPTLTNKSYLAFRNSHALFASPLVRGDIVIFQDKKTVVSGVGEANFVKRVIGLPGDTVSLNDGDVYVNGQKLTEPYVLSADNTWPAGNWCATLKVPAGDIYVLGDNRVRSDDSRAIGFVPIKDVIGYMTMADQQPYAIRWQENDQSTTLDPHTILTDINNLRTQNGSEPLTYSTLLEKAAGNRGDKMLATDDFSYTATRSGYTLQRAMQNVGLSTNTYTGEYFIRSNRQTATKLYQNILGSKSLKNFFLDPRYHSIGIATARGEVEGCNADVTEFALSGLSY